MASTSSPFIKNRPDTLPLAPGPALASGPRFRGRPLQTPSDQRPAWAWGVQPAHSCIQMAPAGERVPPEPLPTAPVNRRSPHSRPHDDSRREPTASNLRGKTVPSRFLSPFGPPKTSSVRGSLLLTSPARANLSLGIFGGVCVCGISVWLFYLR